MRKQTAEAKQHRVYQYICLPSAIWVESHCINRSKVSSDCSKLFLVHLCFHKMTVNKESKQFTNFARNKQSNLSTLQHEAYHKSLPSGFSQPFPVVNNLMHRQSATAGTAHVMAGDRL